MLQKSLWNEAICLKSKVNINNVTSFYSQFGDYIGRLSVFIAAMLLIVAFVRRRLIK